MKEPKDKAWDVIPDIHGQRAKLESLLAKLGYEKRAGAYSHPERRALFLGDYIDRGPDIRGVLQIVRSMVEAGEAVALMGNHELNALHFHHLGPDGNPLRPHEEDKIKQHSATLEQFVGPDAKWSYWLSWFKSLPLTYETKDFRAVHACWDTEALDAVAGRNLGNDQFLVETATKGSPGHTALERLLKGPEINLPEGVTFCDKDGHIRPTMRVRWWGLEGEGLQLSHIAMPPGTEAPRGLVTRDQLAGVQSYASHEKPVFCGHYWMPWLGKVTPLASNVVCLDYSAGREGPLVACRWSGSIEDSEFLVGGAD